MSRLLAELTEANEPFFSMAVHDLENATGSPGADVRLTVDIIGKVQAATEALGLDPKDTSTAELYAALNTKFLEDDKAFKAALGPDSGKETTGKAFKTWFDALKTAKTSWVIKKSSVKKMLKALPPASVMKQLKYKSIESMLKRENASEIIMGVKLLESETWLHKFNAGYKKLNASDFEQRPVELLIFDPGRWEKPTAAFVAARGHNVTHSKELGAIGVLPANTSMPGLLLVQTVFALHYLQEIRIYSSLFKHRQVHRKFGTLLADTLSHDPANAARMVGQDIHWRLVHRHFGTSTGEHPSVFEPNVQPEELSWQSAPSLLAEATPVLSFWTGLEVAGVSSGGRPVSMNILDVARNVSGPRDFDQRTSFYLRLHIWQELLLRYMAHEALEQQVISQLDNDLPIIETVSVSLLGGQR